MSIFDEQDVLLRPPSMQPAGGEARFSDIWAAGRESAKYVDNYNASYKARERAYDEFSDLVRRETGVEIPNPLSEPATLLDQSGEPVPERGYSAIAEEDSLRRFEASRDKLYKQFPAKAQILKQGASIEDDALRIAREAQENYERLMNSRQDFIGKWSAGLGGAIHGSVYDPMQWLSLLAGGGPGAARTVGGRIAVTTLKEMAVNGGFEAAIQPEIQAWREKAGLPHGWDEGMQNVLFAAGFGGAFGALGQTAAEGGRLLAKGRTLDITADDLARILDPNSNVAKGLQGDEAAAHEALKDIRYHLPPQGRGAVDQLDVVSPHTMTEAERQRLGARIKAGTAKAEEPVVPLGRMPPEERTWKTEAERLAGGRAPPRPEPPDTGLPPGAPVPAVLQAMTEAERRALAFRRRGPQPEPEAAIRQESYPTPGPGNRGWTTEAERLALKYAPHKARAVERAAELPSTAALPPARIDWDTTQPGEKFVMGTKRDPVTLTKVSDATITFMTDDGRRVVISKRTTGAADIARPAREPAQEPIEPPPEPPPPEPLPDTGPLSPVDPRDPTRPLEPPDEEKYSEALAYGQDPEANPEFMAKDRLETTGTTDIQTAAREPPGGIDDPLAPEVAKLTEDTLKEYDPSGEFAQKHEMTKEILDDIDNDETLLTLINTCKVIE